MEPLAKLYLKREKVIPKQCDESFLNAQLDVSENTEDTVRRNLYIYHIFLLKTIFISSRVCCFRVLSLEQMLRNMWKRFEYEN